MGNEKRETHFGIIIIVGSILLIVAVCVGLFILYWNFKPQNLNTVLVNGTSYSGQGIIYEVTQDDVYVITAKHILNGMSVKNYARIIAGEQYEVEAEIIYISDYADMAVLIIKRDQKLEKNCKIHFTKVKKNRRIFDELTQSNPVYFTDYDGIRLRKVEGEIASPWIYLTDFELDMMLINVGASQGMSGCGVYSKEGYLAGIVCGSTEDETAVLPFSVLEAEWILVKDENIIK